MALSKNFVAPNGCQYTLKRARAAVATTSDLECIACDTSAGGFGVTLPAAPSIGTFIAVGDDAGVAGANPITVAAAGGVLIDGQANYQIAKNDAVEQFGFDGVEYKRVVLERFIFDERRKKYVSCILAASLAAAAPIPASDLQFTHVANATAAGSFYALITALTSRGWTKTQDSDGTTYSAVGTQITHGGAGAGGLNNNRAWFVIKMPGSNRSLCFQRTNITTNWRISYCADNAFTAGAPNNTTIASPAAGSVEVVLLGGGTPAAPTFAGQFAYADGAFQFHIMVGGPNTKYAIAAFSEDNATRLPGGGLLLDPLRGCSPSDLDPYVVGCTGTSNAAYSVFVNGDVKGNGWFGALNNAANARLCGVRSYSFGSNNLGVNGFSAKDMLAPCCWTRQTATAGAKGWSTLLQFLSVTTRTNMTAFNADGGARNKILSTDGPTPVVLPWDGTNPGVATFDAETFGRVIQ